MRRDKQMASGIDFLGFFTSSPAEAMMSKPMNPKKHFAAPFITPVNPKGKKPPDPKFSGTLSSGMNQFEKSSLKLPHTMTKMMTETLTEATGVQKFKLKITGRKSARQKYSQILFITVDSFAPSASPAKS